ncbi:5690_t:CDS:2 [Dentiscutata heterogama]|uniref:5690_t:CDS:1 n=1 Tax=Dentiscutata heterogama TaxID=1316150 RepID=A0ACA9JZF3_9GLOM|nr:5690_t:CDS:2 [Dentiscutata heterogama]
MRKAFEEGGSLYKHCDLGLCDRNRIGRADDRQLAAEGELKFDKEECERGVNEKQEDTNRKVIANKKGNEGAYGVKNKNVKNIFIYDNETAHNVKSNLASSVNLINIDYVKKKGLIWRRFNNISTIVSTSDDEIIGCVPGVEVDIDSIKVVQKFHVKRGFCCNVILGMPWKATFMISDKSIDEYMNKGSIIKNDDQRKNEFVDVRCIKGKLTENDGAGEEKEKVVMEKTIMLTNESGKDYHEGKIENEKDEQKAFVQCQSLGKMNCDNETRDHKCDDKNKRCIGLGGASMSHPSTI